MTTPQKRKVRWFPSGVNAQFWSFYISEARERKRHRGRQGVPVVMARSCEFLSSPPWGRGWRATGVVISRGEKGAPRSACRGGSGVNNHGHCGNHE